MRRRCGAEQDGRGEVVDENAGDRRADGRLPAVERVEERLGPTPAPAERPECHGKRKEACEQACIDGFPQVSTRHTRGDDGDHTDGQHR